MYAVSVCCVFICARVFVMCVHVFLSFSATVYNVAGRHFMSPGGGGGGGGGEILA